ncbi:monovalent cation/H(+) antiporter subunit G [Nibricoccus sp. IMCC34717]|uniref:monovalent cation/H(+) antiporter subunit G n=1 Tax=Nibricoccus sp. IMCC34717 TaxID=3034021 RepID=UPI00384E2F52
MNWFASLLLIAGAAFVLIAAIGVLRLPDTLFCMHAATKAGAFGVTLLLMAGVALDPSWGLALKSCLAVVFFYLTAPTACHLLARAVLRRERESLRLDVDETRKDGPAR